MKDGTSTTLSLPDGGTIQIPLPGGKGRFLVREPSLLGDGGSRFPTLLVGVLIGGVIGVTAAAWYYRRA